MSPTQPVAGYTVAGLDVRDLKCIESWQRLHIIILLIAKKKITCQYGWNFYLKHWVDFQFFLMPKEKG